MTKVVLLAGLCALLLLACPLSQAQDSLSKTQAETRLKQLSSEINDLKKTLERARTTLSEEQNALRKAGLLIQTNALKLRKLESERQQHSNRLASLNNEREQYLQSLDQRRELLAEQILAAYRLGRESRLKLVLNQDSPARLSRTLAYFNYFSRSQTTRINELKEVLETLDQMQKKITVELLAVDEVKKNQQTVMDDMKDQREQRQLIIENLNDQIGSDETRLTELQADIRDLEALLEKLSDALSDIPSDLGKRRSPADLKGKMQIPVKGRVKHAYGQPRTAGLHWLGWLISTQQGNEVKAIADGRVAYSDWLRGYGLLLIIDHGDGFMSLYANNESLLHDVGEWVEAGTPISTVGSSHQNGNGLYFEIRKNGKALDPAVWLKR